MRLQTLAAGIAVAALIPSFAMAQQSCEQRRSSQTAGTLAGAGIGALLGSAIAGKGDRTAGAVIGGIGGAVVGNQVSKPGADCAHAYGYYDNSGAWHASTVNRQEARGYFDRRGEWVDGAPNGHYASNGEWVRGAAEPAGYYDRNNRWIPVSATGYYANDGQWVNGAASGYYDSRGRWVAGPATGRYDARGRWMPGAPTRPSDVQPGYYDNGRWVAGEVTGYYDGQGRWVRVNSNGTQYSSRPTDVAGRLTWLDDRIRDSVRDGMMTRTEGDRSLRTLSSISRDERSMRDRRGNLSPRSEQMIQARLDTLTNDVRQMRRGPVRQY